MPPKHMRDAAELARWPTQWSTSAPDYRYTVLLRDSYGRWSYPTRDRYEYARHAAACTRARRLALEHHSAHVWDAKTGRLVYSSETRSA